MNELEEIFQKKLNLLNNFKVMFFENKEYFKNYLHSFTLTQVELNFNPSNSKE